MKSDRDRAYINVTVRLNVEANQARRRLEALYGLSTTRFLERMFFNLEKNIVEKLDAEERRAYGGGDLDLQGFKAASNRFDAERAAAAQAEHQAAEAAE
jgi:hypothetical protein